MNKASEIAVAALLLAAGCTTCPHPDSDGWEDVFNKDLSNAECAKPGWAWDKEGYLVPGTGETLFTKKDYKNFVLDLAYVMDPTAIRCPPCCNFRAGSPRRHPCQSAGTA